MAMVTVSVAAETAAELEELVQRLDRPTADVIALAVSDLMARDRSEIAEIEAGLAEAYAGEFASDEDVMAVLAKYARPVR